MNSALCCLRLLTMKSCFPEIQRQMTRIKTQHIKTHFRPSSRRSRETEQLPAKLVRFSGKCWSAPCGSLWSWRRHWRGNSTCRNLADPWETPRNQKRTPHSSNFLFASHFWPFPPLFSVCAASVVETGWAAVDSEAATGGCCSGPMVPLCFIWMRGV